MSRRARRRCGLPPEVPPHEFWTVQQAAATLRCTPRMVAWLVADDRLQAVSCGGVRGVSRRSVDDEIRNRIKPFWWLGVATRRLWHLPEVGDVVQMLDV
ncbi:MAG TPA: hypothetical protein VNA20_01715 [Frankiaceae bacterium]|nr:hypothetical protein [Frankiaceae bacterium]